MTNSSHKRAGQARRHPSFGWMAALHPERQKANDPERFARAMHHPEYRLASAYDPGWIFRNQMGPNCLWLVEDLAREMALPTGARVLDLGCGTALTSIFLGREHGLQVWAADLWIDPSDNRRRIAEAGVADRVFPLRVEARSLPFTDGFFDAVVSVDAFHYFGTEVRYLSYLAQFVRPGGLIAMASPANAVDPDDSGAQVPEALFEEFGADWFTFRSPGWWARHWSRTRGIEVEQSAMVPRSRELWHRYLEASEAWSGEPAAGTADGRLILSDAGASLGFCRIIARRSGAETLAFGPGEFAARIA